MAPVPPHLLDLKARLDRLSPSDRLIVAAELLKAGKDDLGIVIAEQVVLEAQAAKLFAKGGK